MDSKLFIFMAACFSSLYWRSIPTLTLTVTLVCLALVCCFWRKTRLLGCCLLGFSWMASVGHWQYSLQLPLSSLANTLLVQGQIESLSHSHQEQRFNLQIDKIDGRVLGRQRLVRVSWADPLWPLKQGQYVQLMLKLKPPHGLANEGGFHYQQWLFSEGIDATGYVKTSVTNTLLSDEVSFRQRQLDKLLQLNLPQQAWIAALTLGYRGLLQDRDWQLVQSTGIAHLIAISGLHLALVASLSYFLLAWVLGLFISRFYRLHHLNLHKLALIGTVLSTYAYAALAGFALPAARAWIMLTLVIGLFLSNINLHLKSILLVCGCLFLLLFPLSIFGLSFWLSFSAVLIIIFVFWRWPQRHAGFSLTTGLQVMLRIQLALSLLMLPLVAWQFNYISWLSPVVNLLAVPLVTLLVVPVCLVAIIAINLVPPAGTWLFECLDKLLGVALIMLQHAAQNDWGVSQLPAVPLAAWAWVLLAFIILMLPPILRFRPMALVLLLPLLSYGFSPASQNWTLDVLDVGQGTAVLISKDQQALLYDVGPAYPSGFNMADSVILPLLQARGITKIDTLIISHWDNDHSGSLPMLRAQIPIAQVLTNSDVCRIGQQMQWQGLNLQMLWPDDPSLHNDNNSSCVLRVSDDHHSVLLPGDIDAKTERHLLALWGDSLKSDVLLASHHGSNSSSAMSFIANVAPDYVVFSQGFMNRWGFPRHEVVERFNQLGTRMLATSDVGQVTFTFSYQNPAPPVIQTFRQHRHPYWYANFPDGDKLSQF